MARESYTSSTLGEPIPPTGVDSDLHRHPYSMKLKNKINFGPPQDRHRGHLPFFAILDSSALANHLDQPHTYRYPSYPPQTHLSWGKPTLNSFFTFLIPHTGGNLHQGGPTYGSRVKHIIYTRGNPSPHRGGFRSPSSPLHHEAKEQVQFWSTPR